MRISPVALWSRSSLDVHRLGTAATIVSHDHPEGVKGALSVANAGRLAWDGASKAEIREEFESWGYDLGFSCDEIRWSNRFDETCQVCVPQAVVCFLESTDFESAIRLAVSIGGDTDTIAAIVGGLAEAFYKEIPAGILASVRLRLPGEMLSVIDQFYKTAYESVRCSEGAPF
jgi:ADP-ribosylglycohydrolase